MSMRSKLVVAILIVVVAAVVAWRWSRSGDASRGERTAAGSGSASASETRTHLPSSAPPAGNVRRLPPEERRRLAEQINASIQRARASAAAAPATTAHGDGAAAGSDEDPIIPLERASKPLKEALTAAIPLLADCYKQQPGGAAKQTAVAMMAMASDPDLGTVIDTSGITDADGKPIDPKVDECLRDTIDSLAFPPLGEVGKLQLQYSFRFDDSGSDK